MPEGDRNKVVMNCLANGTPGGGGQNLKAMCSAQLSADSVVTGASVSTQATFCDISMDLKKNCLKWI